MTTSCAIIACDHGLGHIRRCALITKAIGARGIDTTLFAPSASMQRLQRAVPHLTGLKLCDFGTGTRPESIREGLRAATEWLERLPDLAAYDVVVCDNLPEILQLRPDAILSAQFFWHDALEGAAIDYAGHCEYLLQQQRPTVIGTGLFAMDAVRSQPGFQSVGLYSALDHGAKSDATLSTDSPGDLLFTGGTTLSARSQLFRSIDELLKQGSAPFEQVHVDPELLPAQPPSWMVPATFTAAMYARVIAAICRPGLGALTDLLVVGARPFVMHEGGNAEMSYNTGVLCKWRLGQALKKTQWLDEVKEYANAHGERNEQRRRCARLYTHGVSEAAEVILRCLSSLAHAVSRP